MPFKKVLLLFVALVLPMNTRAAETQGRQRLSLDADWRFHLGPVAGSVIDNGYTIPKWRYMGPVKTKPTDETPAGLDVDTKGSEWNDAENGKDVFNQSPGFAWYRAELPNAPGPHRLLHFTAVDDNATVYVNGQKMLYHVGWNDSFDVNLDSVWKEGGPNQLAVLVENTYGGGYIKETYLLSVGQEEKVPPVVLDGDTGKDWATVHLPHDFVVEGTFIPRATLPMASFRKMKAGTARLSTFPPKLRARPSGSTLTASPRQPGLAERKAFGPPLERLHQLPLRHY